jgi:hypothetical protein
MTIAPKAGHALHLRQLAFATECALWARQDGHG